VLLVSEDGYVIEGATTSLLWWDGNVLCVPDQEQDALASVTAGVIVEEARAQSIPGETRRVRPDELIGYETWLVNALHGIRRVRTFVDGRRTRSSVQPRGMVLSDRADSGRQLHKATDRFDCWREWMESFTDPPDT
jgi:branched-subunit amino acid aminotransferase/4-amino-4-deoxychorismate lyase